MNVMIDADTCSTLSLDEFEDILSHLEEGGADIRIISRGLPGRVGDENNYLRTSGTRYPVHFTEGVPPTYFMNKHESWDPEIVLFKPMSYMDSPVFNKPEVLI